MTALPPSSAALAEEYKFCDERYSKEILKRLNKLRENQVMCDVIIKIDNQEFPAHRNILSASSDYFLAMFNGNMKESTEQSIYLNGIGAETMRAILHFIYTGEIYLNKNNVENILQAANLLLVQTVKDACCRFLESRLTITNALAIQLFAEIYACEELHTIASEFIHQNFTYVSETEDFLSLSPRQVAMLLQSDEINAESEEKIYEALMRWIKSDIRARRQHFPELIKHIRLPLISPYYLVDFVEKESLFNMTPSCRSLLLEAQHYHMLPERRVEVDNAKIRPRQYERLHESLMVIGGNGDITPLTTGKFIIANIYLITNYFSPTLCKTKTIEMRSGVANSIIGGRAHIHILEFTDHENNRFQRNWLYRT